MRLYFISDQHLDDPKQEKCQALLRFFKSIKTPDQCRHLFLVGDIFDVWAGSHDYFIQKWFLFNRELLRLKNLGIEIHYFEGNHDLYLQDYYRNQLGFHVYEGPHYFDFEGKVIRVEHGDQMDPKDKGYLFLRWFLRTGPVSFFFKKAPSTVVQSIGEWASGKSRDYTSSVKTIRQSEIEDLMRRHAKVAYKERPFSLLVAGHVHHRVDEIVDINSDTRARVLNLGYQEAPLLIEIK